MVLRRWEYYKIIWFFRRSGEGLTLETSAFESLYGGQLLSFRYTSPPTKPRRPHNCCSLPVPVRDALQSGLSQTKRMIKQIMALAQRDNKNASNMLGIKSREKWLSFFRKNLNKSTNLSTNLFIKMLLFKSVHFVATVRHDPHPPEKNITFKWQESNLICR